MMYRCVIDTDGAVKPLLVTFLTKYWNDNHTSKITLRFSVFVFERTDIIILTYTPSVYDLPPLKIFKAVRQSSVNVLEMMRLVALRQKRDGVGLFLLGTLVIDRIIKTQRCSPKEPRR